MNIAQFSYASQGNFSNFVILLKDGSLSGASWFSEKLAMGANLNIIYF